MGELYNPFPKLPKNIRQIGDQDQVVRFYMEDYVNTYLKRLYPTGSQTMRVGLLLGSTEQYDGTPYIFVDGALEMEDVETDGERILFSESSWKKAYRRMEEAFPKRTIQGWFLCGGPGSQLSPLNYWKQHGQYFAGKNQLMYLNHGLEGEEAIYITSEDGFYRLKGHCIYYERNQMMQDYMITRKDVRRVESGSHEKVIRDFRSRMSVKKEQAVMQSRAAGGLGLLCGVLSVAVLAGGVALINNYSKMQRMESVLASVLPAGVVNWTDYEKQKAEEPDFIIEELPGKVYPTEKETGETYTAETMESSVEEAVPSETISESSPGEETETQKLVGMGKESGQGDAAETVQPSIDYEAAAANGYRIYEIGEGETLYGICWKMYGSLSHLREICSLNGLEDENRILAGQKLILP
ncbi:MAG: LysM peptidoglycan-binding domain-containing protein [Lachnospiraceae bacterium]|nr:LysM peptidoglycan-binding domain-containing protein [Lachnospiraceae bacterium]